MRAVSFVVPVFNGRRHLRRVLDAIAREARGHPHEIIVVDDGSTDGSARMVESFRLKAEATDVASVRLIRGRAMGAAAAMNTGIAEARHPFIAQIDQDVVVESGWLARLMARFDDPQIAAVQGRYVTAAGARFWARMAGRDLDVRYARLGHSTDHVCTGNVIYRATALHQAGLFDERLGYGYDNDLSYRLAARGYRLAFEAGATAIHFWRDTAAGYARHQYGVGYGRLDVVRGHPHRARGDAVSGALMMAHAPLTLLALALLAAWPLSRSAPLAGLAIAAALACERLAAGVRAWRITGDRSTLLFPVVHLFRDVVWVAAILAWLARRIVRHAPRAAHSMPRLDAPSRATTDTGAPFLVLIPAYNEAQSLRAVIDDIRRRLPAAAVLVIDDASTDGTREMLPSLGVEWLSLPQQLGVGGALRVGVRYARRRGHAIVARMDGDGQHRAADLARVLGAVVEGDADAAAGSRYLGRPERRTPRRITQRVLALCLSTLTRQRVTDPTSGLWVFGPRAVEVLLDHHPGGYPEPELRLVMARHRLRVREVPIRARPRRAGRTSLTPARTAIAFARTALAVMTAPLERGSEDRP